LKICSEERPTLKQFIFGGEIVWLPMLEHAKRAHHGPDLGDMSSLVNPGAVKEIQKTT
jgi:hypothetical protein